ncbi:transcriptional regulation of mitochondrial recombination-domain-containing protein [Hypoxylon trugodes]|uniref:transcriptional regulation of mitochondrial recombination-domain-containing protein n=1 Tax=Hypoxylon trugodes TaxID=326681 RepID=UPI0021A20DD5|nr:transcriptional regulation of mitochondrial recombination-domain-containing protein [Hypoxylon trugodes]KAI1393516.1 transcriptional regulation of mitochondrial recombination-domain-containing protein [Hypoxylon trugodes]
MALRVNPITAQLGKLSIGISRTSIRFVYNQTTLPRTKEEKRRKELERSKLPPHHGEKIWIFNHFLEGFTVYSHSPILKANKALRQIPFNGKKLKPSKLRKDYWKPLAMIQFPEGYGEVGRSVFQRLRECKMFHELSWGDDMYFSEDGKPLTKIERGRKLNNQKANTIADMAAVLGGQGKGNKIWATVPEKIEDIVNVEASDENNVKHGEEGPKALVKATVWWTNDQDQNYATSWPSNVSHYRFDQATLEKMKVEDDAEGGDGTKSPEAPAELVAEQQLQKGSDQRTSV